MIQPEDNMGFAEWFEDKGPATVGNPKPGKGLLTKDELSVIPGECFMDKFSKLIIEAGPPHG